MASKRPSVMASGLLARKGAAPARTTEIEDLPREATEERPVLPFKIEAPPAPTAPQQAEPEKAGGIKQRTVGTTLYLLPDESWRLKQVAIARRVSLHDLILDGIDRILAEHQEPPLTRYTAPRPRK